MTSLASCLPLLPSPCGSGFSAVLERKLPYTLAFRWVSHSRVASAWNVLMSLMMTLVFVLQWAVPFMILVVCINSNLIVSYIVSVAAGASVAAAFLLPWWVFVCTRLKKNVILHFKKNGFSPRKIKITWMSAAVALWRQHVVPSAFVARPEC